jgi:hypothetical protein
VRAWLRRETTSLLESNEESCPAKSRTSVHGLSACQVKRRSSHAPHPKSAPHEASNTKEHFDTCCEPIAPAIMSAEDGSTQPPAAGNDKAQPAKPAAAAPAAAFTSSFINSELRRAYALTALKHAQRTRPARSLRPKRPDDDLVLPQLLLLRPSPLPQSQLRPWSTRKPSPSRPTPLPPVKPALQHGYLRPPRPRNPAHSMFRSLRPVCRKLRLSQPRPKTRRLLWPNRYPPHHPRTQKP